MQTQMYLPLLLVPLMLVWMLWNKRRAKAAIEENADKNAGVVAERLGLQVVEGDPKQNLLYFLQPMGDYARTIRMVGRPYGRPTEFWVHDGRKVQEYIVASKTTWTFGSRLEVEVAQIHAFEVMLRQPNAYLKVEGDFQKPPLPEVRTGVPHLDAHFIVRAGHPGIGPALVGALQLLATHHYVHLAGAGQKMWIKWERISLGYFAHSAEEYMLALETAACALEGRPAPAHLGAQPGAHHPGAHPPGARA